MKMTVCAYGEPAIERNSRKRVMMEILSFRRVFHPQKRQTQYLAAESQEPLMF